MSDKLVDFVNEYINCPTTNLPQSFIVYASWVSGLKHWLDELGFETHSITLGRSIDDRTILIIDSYEPIVEEQE